MMSGWVTTAACTCLARSGSAAILSAASPTVAALTGAALPSPVTTPAAWTTVFRIVWATAASLAVLSELGLIIVMIWGINCAISGNNARNGIGAPWGFGAPVGGGVADAGAGLAAAPTV